jgi:hypothetical protein
MVDIQLTPVEKYKYSMLNHSLEINEIKKYHNQIPIELYLDLLDGFISFIDSYEKLESWHDEYVRRVEKAIGIKGQ